MRESGVLPKDAETEPCDSAWNEWAFLSFLLGSEAASLEAEDEEAVALWRGRVADFVRDHAALWLPDFLTRTAEEVERLAQAARWTRRPSASMARWRRTGVFCWQRLLSVRHRRG